MRRSCVVAIAALAYAGAAAVAAQVKLSPQDASAAFKAAGFKPVGKKWVACTEGQISEVRDINGDGLPEVLITEGGTACHGMTGAGYSLVSKQANGAWKLVSGGTGVPIFLPGQAVAGWPDLQIGGPGFCFPVHRWSAQGYKFHRNEYEGKRCTR